MPTHRPALRLATLALLCCIACAGRFVPARPADADAKPPPPAPTAMQSLFQEKCSACHNLPDPQADQRTRPQWQRIVNQMLTRYHASDEITQPQAAQIVDYLATFAPPPQARRGDAASPRDPWATDTLDVWPRSPSLSRIFNFESGPVQPGLAAGSSGTPGPAAVWHSAQGTAGPDSTFVKVVPVQPSPARFALLVDRADTGRDIDTRVRFQIIAGRMAPAVGLAFGLSDPAHCLVLRLDAKAQALSVLALDGDTHTILQSTPLPAPLSPGWHTLRLLVSSGSVRGWLDGTKRIRTQAPAYAGGKVALWSQGDTIAAFDDWTVDFYDTAPAAPPA